MDDDKKVKDVFAKHIAKIRKNRNMTQGTFADLLEVGVSTVSDWETGKKLPRAGVIERIARTFNITKSSLFQEESSSPWGEKKLKDNNELIEGIKRIMAKHEMDLTDPKTFELLDSALDLIKRMRSE
jgi:transcriptional regulator with XRE-family HTH domain